jgi:hypothetical protein
MQVIEIENQRQQTRHNDQSDRSHQSHQSQEGYGACSPAGAGCAVCGSQRVERDAVFDDLAGAGSDVLYLAECRRCEHRWTWRAAPVAVSENAAQAVSTSTRPVRTPRIAPGRREVASAA